MERTSAPAQGREGGPLDSYPMFLHPAQRITHQQIIIEELFTCCIEYAYIMEIFLVKEFQSGNTDFLLKARNGKQS